MRTLLLLCLLSSYPGIVHAAAPVEIWWYAFITTEAQGPVGGEGKSIFKPVGESLEGPMWSVDHRLGFRLKFSVKESAVNAILTPEKDPGQQIELHGTATQAPEPDGKGCAVHVSLVNGVHHILLQHLIDKCAT
jgi:hypothetical protein